MNIQSTESERLSGYELEVIFICTDIANKINRTSAIQCGQERPWGSCFWVYNQLLDLQTGLIFNIFVPSLADYCFVT